MKFNISESKLKQIIAESVKNVLRENNDLQGASYDLADNIKMCMGSDELCNRLMSRLAGQIDWRGVYETLQEIYNTECSNEDDEEIMGEAKSLNRKGTIEINGERIPATEDKLDKNGNPTYKVNHPSVNGRKDKYGNVKVKSYTFKPE